MVVTRGIRFLVVAISLLLIPQVGFCWGKIGHQAVALIAQDNLDPTTKQQVQTILGTMAIQDAAIWPDQVKSTAPWVHTKTYHYSDISKGDTYWTKLNGLSSQELAQGDMVRALLKCETILRDSSSSADQKKWALSFMIHFMGDLHQPLHAGYPEDLGGNSISISYFGKSTNLHAVWDTSIIENSLNTGATPNVQDYLNQLRQPSKSEIGSWQQDYVLNWMNDAMSFREVLYGDAGLSNQNYQDKYQSVVETQILKGGYRLAAWLNAIFSNQKFGGNEAITTRDQIAKITGDPDDADIVLEPNAAKIGMQIKGFEFLDPFCGHFGDDGD